MDTKSRIMETAFKLLLKKKDLIMFP